MKNSAKTLLALSFCLLVFSFHSWSQNENKATWLGVFIGKMNYQGDLNPNSFVFARSKATAAVTVRQSFNRWLSLKGGLAIGSIQAADKYNRDYLKKRNLSFYTTIKEASISLETSLLDLSTTRFTPYIHGSIALYHFNPWAYDNNGDKTFLQPLSTEGQGLSQFPRQKPYRRTQLSVGFGVGARYAINESMNLGVEFSQRKTFTDYLDDVSSIYVDRNVLLQAKGTKAVEMAFRGNELPGGSAYPGHGEQRGTPSEMDWYYFFGLNIEIRFSAFAKFFRILHNENSGAIHNLRCPRNVLQ
ncbi:MAG TPA: DUF6089 family protein [Chitinophagaceae bacterium]|nr:DUF6089 family protein [Chitinophagaceae bacterium]